MKDAEDEEMDAQEKHKTEGNCGFTFFPGFGTGRALLELYKAG